MSANVFTFGRMDIKEKIKKAVREVPDFPRPGILFKDITPLVLDSNLSSAITEALTEQVWDLRPTALCGIESRGFLFGVSMAQQLGIPLILIRKAGKLPGRTIAVSYELEYGTATVEMHATDLPVGSRVIVHDDLLATGGTATAAAELVKRAGSETVGFSFLTELSFLKGRARLERVCPEVRSLVTY